MECGLVSDDLKGMIESVMKSCGVVFGVGEGALLMSPWLLSQEEAEQVGQQEPSIAATYDQIGGICDTVTGP